MDIVKRCSNYLSSGGLFNPEFADHDAVRDLVIYCRDEIERLREDLDLIKKIARAEIDAKLRYAAALRNIADIEHEDLAAPKSPAEAVLWVCLDRCVTLAENALKREG